MIEGDKVFGEVLHFLFVLVDGLVGVVDFGLELVVLVFEFVQLLLLWGSQLEGDNLVSEEVELLLTIR